jgi:argininosuccinate lyase
MARMIAGAKDGLAADARWVAERRARIDGALASLDRDFSQLLPATP